MTYVAEIAERIRQEVPEDLVPDENTSSLFRIYAVLALSKGEKTTARDVHDAWAAWMSGLDPSHDALVPFDELSSSTKAADEPYVAAIRAVAIALK